MNRPRDPKAFDLLRLALDGKLYLDIGQRGRARAAYVSAAALAARLAEELSHARP